VSRVGAVEFLTKPFGDAILLKAIRNAIERSGVLLGREAETRELKARLLLLAYQTNKLAAN
jgi:FixJ family two-component response regulator